jgi:ABC-2 type transport system permease protein
VLAFVTLGLGAFSRSIAEEQRAGTLEMLLSTPTRLPVLLAGTFVVPLAFTLLQVAVLSVVGVAFGMHVHAGGVLLAVPIMALLVVDFCAFGVFSAAFIVLTQRGDPLTLLATQGTTFLAGTLVPVSVLPVAVRAVAHLVPAFYGLDALRRVLLVGAGLQDVAGDVIALCLFAAVLVPLSLASFAWALRVARRAGTLGTY